MRTGVLGPLKVPDRVSKSVTSAQTQRDLNQRLGMVPIDADGLRETQLSLLKLIRGGKHDAELIVQLR